MKRNRQTQRRHRSFQGFTLLEVLVALVIFSVGLLGLAALQSEGLRSGWSAFLRTRAVILSADIVDRMRANPGAMASYVVALGNDGVDNTCASHGGTEASDCTGAQMAQHDIFLWKSGLENGLPAGDGQIAVDNTTDPPSYTVSIQWTERGEALTHSVEVQLCNWELTAQGWQCP